MPETIESCRELPMAIADNVKDVAVDVAVDVTGDMAEIELALARCGLCFSQYDPRWLAIVNRSFRHRPYLLIARRGEQIVGVLPLALVKSLIFGRFLVSLPYVNTAGVIADDDVAALRLIDRAIQLADELRVRYLELRHEAEVEHPQLNGRMSAKVHMRLSLPATVEALREQLKSKTRNKVRKGEEQGFTVHFGRHELLPEFYAVFSRNMRDLGTPVFGRSLFNVILDTLPSGAEFCVVRDGELPIAAALLIHGDGVTQVPSASSLRDYNSTNANDLMYWRLLARAVERGQGVFDFGRSTIDSPTYVFKKKWGAQPHPAVWQYYVRKGEVGQMRPENGKFQAAIRLWQKLPLTVANWLGPSIVRCIP